MMTDLDNDSPRYTARQLGDYWVPYDEQRQRYVRQAVFTQAGAQEIADQLNAAGVDWTYADDPADHLPDDHRPRYRWYH